MKVIFEYCIIFTCVTTVAALLSSQGHSQVAAGGLWYLTNKKPRMLSLPITQET
jgi:hypothetical protein